MEYLFEMNSENKKWFVITEKYDYKLQKVTMSSKKIKY